MLSKYLLVKKMRRFGRDLFFCCENIYLFIYLALRNLIVPYNSCMLYCVVSVSITIIIKFRYRRVPISGTDTCTKLMDRPGNQTKARRCKLILNPWVGG